MQIGNPSLLVINTQVDLCSPVGSVGSSFKIFNRYYGKVLPSDKAYSNLE